MQQVTMQNLVSILFTLLSSIPLLYAQSSQYVISQDSQGNIIYLADSRRPSLYTEDFGACLQSSSVNINRFDAAYYKDNMTVLFHLSGGTVLKNESLMMSIDLYAYGKSRFNRTFDPCNANITSLCPLNANVPIEADGRIPVSQFDVRVIPTTAFKMPDFAGQVTMRIFANSTQSEVGCYTAIITNGNSFSQPVILGSVLGSFTLIAVLASFATAIYGDNITAMHTRHTHSLSVSIIFAVFQHIFYTGMISLNWPHVLVAWWSNFSWAGGMVHTEWMQYLISQLTGSGGRKVQIEPTYSARSDASLDGAFNSPSIYPQLARDRNWHDRAYSANITSRQLLNRDSSDAAGGYKWCGKAVRQGLPLPGDRFGFAGTLAQENIPISNAFLTGLLWLLILIGITIMALTLLKLFLEGLSRSRLVKQERLFFFRAHWLGFLAQTILRILFVAYFMLSVLALFQFAYGASPVVLALAALSFVIFCMGMFSTAGYACYRRISIGDLVVKAHQSLGKAFRALNFLACGKFSRHALGEGDDRRSSTGAGPLCNTLHASSDAVTCTPGDEEFLKRFYWLAGRFRASRWWFFGPWLLYQLVEACFYGGAHTSSLVQIFGLLTLEAVALAMLLVLKPFQRQHLNALMMYLLGFSKVATIALCIAFETRFQLTHVISTTIGIVIIAVQASLVLCLLLAIVLSATMSYVSLTRDHGTLEFGPGWSGLYRERPMKQVEDAAKKFSCTSSSSQTLKSQEWKEPCFCVHSVYRVAKIEDEYPDTVYNSSNLSLNRSVSGDGPFTPSQIDTADPDAITPLRVSTPSSSSPHQIHKRASLDGKLSPPKFMSYTSLPRAARVHRVCWSSHESLQTRNGALSSYSGSLSHTSTGYSYAGVYIRDLDVRQATSPTNDAEHLGRSMKKHERQWDLEDATVNDLGGEATSARPMSVVKRGSLGRLDEDGVTGVSEDVSGAKKPNCGPETTTTTIAPVNAECSKESDRTNDSEDENEDAINGTTLFEDSNAGNFRRKEDEAFGEKHGPASSVTLPTSAASEKESGAEITTGLNRKTHQVQRLRQVPDRLHQIGKLSLGETFALDLLFPPGSPLRGNAETNG